MGSQDASKSGQDGANNLASSETVNGQDQERGVDGEMYPIEGVPFVHVHRREAFPLRANSGEKEEKDDHVFTAPLLSEYLKIGTCSISSFKQKTFYFF